MFYHTLSHMSPNVVQMLYSDSEGTDQLAHPSFIRLGPSLFIHSFKLQIYVWTAKGSSTSYVNRH